MGQRERKLVKECVIVKAEVVLEYQPEEEIEPRKEGLEQELEWKERIVDDRNITAP